MMNLDLGLLNYAISQVREELQASDSFLFHAPDTVHLLSVQT